MIKNPVSADAVKDLQAAGFLAVDPEYRLAPGLGGECAHEQVPCGSVPGQTSDGRYPQQTNDLAAAVAALKKDPRCNGQVFAVGGSAGAYHALFLAAKGLVTAAAALSPATDLDLLVAGGGSPGQKGQNYAPGHLTEASPNTYLDIKTSRPFYLVAYSSDEMPASQFNSTIAKMGELGPFDYKATLITGAGHSWSAWPQEGAAVIDFFKAHLTTPTPRPTPSPSASPTATPTPSSTPTPIPTATPIAAHGLYQIGGDPSGNPNINGDCAALYWNRVETAAGVYDWSVVDAKIAAMRKAGKQIRFAVLTLNSAPQFILDAGAKSYTSPKYGDQFVLPWDPVVQPKLQAFLSAVCQHLDGKVDYLDVGGIGVRVESYMPLPAEIGLTTSIPDFITAWINASKQIVDTYGQNLKLTPFVIAAGTPFKDPSGQGALQTVLDYGLKYPHFGAMQWGLNAKSNSSFYINAWIKAHDDGRPSGFQMTGASDGSVGGNLQGTFEQCLAAADALGADIVEIYEADAALPANAPVLQTYNAKLR